MGKFYKMPENKDLILDSDELFQKLTDFQLDGLHIEIHMERDKRREKKR